MKTANLGLAKPQMSDVISDSIPALAISLDVIDTKLGNLSGIVTDAPVNQYQTVVLGNDGDVGYITVKIGADYAVILVYPEAGTGDGVGYINMKSSANIVGNVAGTSGWGFTKDASNHYVLQRRGASVAATSMTVGKIVVNVS